MALGGADEGDSLARAITLDLFPALRTANKPSTELREQSLRVLSEALDLGDMPSIEAYERRFQRRITVLDRFGESVRQSTLDESAMAYSDADEGQTVQVEGGKVSLCPVRWKPGKPVPPDGMYDIVAVTDTPTQSRH